MPRTATAKKSTARPRQRLRVPGTDTFLPISDVEHAVSPRLVRMWQHLQENSPLPKISAKQYLFCREVVRGASFIGAYRQAFTASAKLSDFRTAAKAAKLAKQPYIGRWISHLQETEKEGSVITANEQVSDLAKLKHLAVEAGDNASAVRAQTEIGKVSGLYIDRSITETTVTFTPTSLEQALIARNPALAERLRQARAIADSMDGEVPLLDLTPDVVSEPVSSSRKRDKT